MSDTARFEAWVREHHAGAYRAALRVLGREQDARDAVQHAFVCALRQRDRLAAAGDPGRVLRWLAVKGALQFLRGERSRRQRERRSTMPEPEPGPEPRAQQADEQDLLRRLVAQLPEDLRMAVQLRFQDDLTYDQIADLAACSKPAAHDRVKRGLERLRLALTRAGAGAAALHVEARLAEAGEDAPVPTDLAQVLLRTVSAPAAAGAPMTLGAILLLLGSTLGLGWLASRHDPRGSPAPAAAHTASALPTTVTPLPAAMPHDPPRREAVAPAGPAGASEDRDTVLRGQVLHVDGRPAPGMLVRASSVAHAGKFAAIVGEATSDADGRFALALAVDRAGGRAFTLEVWYDGVCLHRGEDVHVPAAGESTGHVLQLTKPLEERPGAYTLDVEVTDPDGAPLAGAICVLYRMIPYVGAVPFALREASAHADGGGRTRLEGSLLGPKRLDVHSPPPHSIEFSTYLRIGEPGPHRHVVRMEARTTIQGHLGAVDGGVPERPQVWVVGADEPNRWTHARVEPDGRFVLEGLKPGSYTLHATAPGFADATVEDVPCGRGDLLVELKRFGDPRDHGTHRAEIHGFVRHARSGAPVALGPFEIEWLPVPDDLDAAAWQADFQPNHLFPPLRQTGFFGELPPPTDQFHFMDLAPGRYAVRLLHPEHAVAFAGPIDLGGSEIRTGVVLLGEEGGSLAGRVVDPAGHAIGGAIVFLTGTGPISDAALAERDDAVRRAQGDGTFWFAHVRTDGGGRFRFTRVPAALPIRVAAIHAEYAPTTSGVTPVPQPGARAEVEIAFTQRRTP